MSNDGPPPYGVQASDQSSWSATKSMWFGVGDAMGDVMTNSANFTVKINGSPALINDLASAAETNSSEIQEIQFLKHAG
jgi:hypothetical protein